MDKRSASTRSVDALRLSTLPNHAVQVRIYSHLHSSHSISSIANLTRRDGEEFLELAPKAAINTFKLEQTNEALQRLRNGDIRGAAVLVME